MSYPQLTCIASELLYGDCSDHLDCIEEPSKGATDERPSLEVARFTVRRIGQSRDMPTTSPPGISMNDGTQGACWVLN